MRAVLTGPSETVAKARALRRSLSPPEAMLWQKLRPRPNGLKFRRQHPAGRYILDFYCAQSQLAVEIDGRSHDCEAAPEHDARRDAWLREQGIRVLRVLARDVLTDPDSVVARLVAAVALNPPLHRASARSPSPDGGGAESGRARARSGIAGAGSEQRERP